MRAVLSLFCLALLWSAVAAGRSLRPTAPKQTSQRVLLAQRPQGCKPGFYANSAAKCLVCPGGSFCLGGLSAPKACPTNMLTRRKGAKAQTDCLNKPGFYVARKGKRAAAAEEEVGAAAAAGYDPVTALPCGPDTYSEGLEWQTACTPCPGGLKTDPANPLGSHTSAAVCEAPPGSYITADNTTAPCPKGTFAGGYAARKSCTPCADRLGAGVTTERIAATSLAACSFLQPGFAAVVAGKVATGALAAGQTLSAASTCPQNLTCSGGDPAAEGAPEPCPRGMWTDVSPEALEDNDGRGAVSSAECLAPPGWFVPARGDIQECASGSFKEGWDLASSCTPCGDGPWLSDRTTELVVGFAREDNEEHAYVRGGFASCFIQPGMGAVRMPSLQGDNTMTLKAVVCPAGLFGTSINRFGNDAASCQACPADMATTGTKFQAASYQTPDGTSVEITAGGYTSVEACRTKAGWGYGDLGDGVSRPCDVGFYNSGDNMQPCQECPFGTTTAEQSSTSVADCIFYAPGYGKSSAGTPALCPIGTYSDGRLRVGLDACTPCGSGRTTWESGATSEQLCNLCAVGFGGPTAASCKPCGDGTYGARPWDSRGADTSCASCPTGRQWSFTWDDTEVFEPRPISPPNAKSASECLSDFSQTVEDLFHLEINPSHKDMKALDVLSLPACVEACRDSDACAAVTFDYEHQTCKVWHPSSGGSTYANGGGIAFKVMTSSPLAQSVNDKDAAANKDTASAAAAAPAAPAAVTQDDSEYALVSAKAMGSGFFSFWPGAATATAALDADILVPVHNVGSLTACLEACTFQNLCSGVAFGPLDAARNIGTIAGTTNKCQMIMGSSTPDSRRTLIRAKHNALRPY